MKWKGNQKPISSYFAPKKSVTQNETSEEPSEEPSNEPCEQPSEEPSEYNLY